MNSRRIAFLLIFLFAVSGIVVCLAANPDIKILLYGKPLDMKPVEKDGILYVPLEAFCAELNIPFYKKDGVYHVGEKKDITAERPAYKYFLKVSDAFGQFEAKVIINGKIAGDYTGEAEEEVTEFFHKGKNEVIIRYNDIGEGGGYDIVIDEKVGDSTQSRINFSMVWTEESQGKGEKKFTLDVP